MYHLKRHETRRNRLCILVLIATLFIQPAFSQTFTFTPVALEGQPAQGADGTFWIFGPHVDINDSGGVLFSALLKGGTAESGIFVFSGGKITPVALQGQTAPGTGGARFTEVTAWAVLNNSGDVAFNARIDDGRKGIFLFSKGEISLLVLDAQTPPQVNPQFQYPDVTLCSLNDAGEVFFYAGWDKTKSIFRLSHGTISLIASPEGTAFNAFACGSANNRGDIVFANLVNLGFPFGISTREVLLFSQGEIRQIFSSKGSLTGLHINDFGAIVLSDSNKLYLYKDGSLSAIDDAPNLSQPRINNSGVVPYIYGQFFNGHMASGGLKIYDGRKTMNIRTGEASVPGVGMIIGFGPPAINNAGMLAFSALIAGGPPTKGVFVAASASLQPPRRRP